MLGFGLAKFKSNLTRYGLATGLPPNYAFGFSGYERLPLVTSVVTWSLIPIAPLEGFTVYSLRVYEVWGCSI